MSANSNICVILGLVAVDFLLSQEWVTQAYIILLHFANTAVFYKLKVCGNPVVEQVYWCHFSYNVCSLCVRVTFWWFSQCFKPSISKKITTHWRLRWWLVFFSNKVFFKLKYAQFFRHNVIAHLTGYSTSITFIGTGRQKNSCDLLNCSSLEPNL